LKDLPLSQEINVCLINELCGRNAKKSHEAFRLVDTWPGTFALGKNDY
jgi:hypothetical protein